jgi:hypothetical protein
MFVRRLGLLCWVTANSLNAPIVLMDKYAVQGEQDSLPVLGNGTSYVDAAGHHMAAFDGSIVVSGVSDVSQVSQDAWDDIDVGF